MAQLLTASLRNDLRIAIKSPYSAKDFVASLPGSRWEVKSLSWVCRYTSATCYRIVYDHPHDCRVECDDTIRDTALNFFRSLNPVPDECPQPEKRRLDAWKHQARAFAFAMQREATLLNMGMGTGKSAVAINAIQNSGAKTVLILCPVSVRSVWRREFHKHCVVPHEIMILDKGSTKEKTERSKQFLELRQSESRILIVVVNYDTAWREPFGAWATSFAWDMAICDESQRIMSADSSVSKWAGKIKARRRLCLTGTPMATPLSLFGQFRFLDPGIYGDSFHRFRSTYAISGHFGASHIVGYKNQDDLGRRMALLTFTVGREVLDLPPVTHNVRTCELSPASKKLYREMEEDLIAFMDDGGEVTAPNGMVKLLRLQQITSGHLKAVDEHENETVHTIGTEKLDVLEEILDELGPGEPLVVFCNFIHDLDSIRDLCERVGRSYGELSGRHKDLDEHAQIPPGFEVFGVQYQSGGVGVDLTRAAYCCFFSATYNGLNFEQALARTHRPGQLRPVVYHHILCLESVDVTVYRALREKRDVVGEVIRAMRGEEFDDRNDDDLGLGVVCGAGAGHRRRK